MFLSEVGNSTLDAIKSLGEYLSEQASKDFTSKQANMFEFSHVRTITKCRELDHWVGPVAVVATAADLESGAARQLFAEWSGDPNNRVVFTDTGAKGTLQHTLIHEKPKKVEIKLWKEVLLEGAELSAHRSAKQAEAAAVEAERRAKIEEMQVDTDAADRDLDAMDMEQVSTIEGLIKR